MRYLNKKGPNYLFIVELEFRGQLVLLYHILSRKEVLLTRRPLELLKVKDRLLIQTQDLSFSCNNSKYIKKIIRCNHMSCSNEISLSGVNMGPGTN